MNLESGLPLALRRAYLAMHRRCDARFARYGVTADQFVLIATLARAPEITQRDLATRISSDPSTVRAMLILLERQGILKRKPHPDDARARSVCLTPKGMRLFQKLWDAGESIRQQMTKILGNEDAQVLLGLLDRLACGLGNPGFADHETMTPSLHGDTP